MRLRVMLVERSTLVRSGLRRVLEEDTDIMKKIGVRKATALALFAAERGLVARK